MDNPSELDFGMLGFFAGKVGDTSVNISGVSKPNRRSCKALCGGMGTSGTCAKFQFVDTEDEMDMMDDEEIMRQADLLIDIGPGAGIHGGHVPLNAPTIHRRNADISPALRNAALPEVLKRAYANRGIQNPAELSLTLDQLLPPQQLKGVTEAAELLADAIEGDARVLIVGDFDADGQRGTSDLLMWLGVYGYACD